MRAPSALKPDVPSFGYATFLSINATSIWGGIYPYLPAFCQTSLTTIVFYTVQIAVFWLAFCAAMAFTWARPGLSRGAHVLAFSAPLAFGPLMLVGAMYLESLALALVVGAAALIGVGSAGYLMSWQRVFASLDSARGNLALIKGTGFSALLYFFLCFIPTALTAYLIPLVLVPLAGLCLWIAAHATDAQQPMFDDVPREHAVVYKNALCESFLPALSVGALGFCSGAIRFIAVTHQELLSTINIFSMSALLAVVAVFYGAWRRRTIHVDLMSVFRVLFPIAATCLIVLPFAGGEFTTVGSGVTYACFMLACVLMMMHCGQISRDSGINPVFIYGFFGGVAYIMQSAGFLLGWVSDFMWIGGREWLFIVAMVSSYVLGLTLLAATGTLFKSLAAKGTVTADPIEFLAVGAPEEPRQQKAAKPAAKRRRNRPSASEDAGVIRDRTSKQCLMLQEAHGLSTRETEVMELIARGNSMVAIAERLVISENTVRTHAKHIYTKLDIHRRQELLDMLHE